MTNYLPLPSGEYVLASLVLEAQGSGFGSQRGHLFFEISPRGEISQGVFAQGAGFPSCHKSIYRVSEDNFRGSACVSEWMLISAKDGGWSFIT
jgi:hypothetical protein